MLNVYALLLYSHIALLVYLYWKYSTKFYENEFLSKWFVIEMVCKYVVEFIWMVEYIVEIPVGGKQTNTFDKISIRVLIKISMRQISWATGKCQTIPFVIWCFFSQWRAWEYHMVYFNLKFLTIFFNLHLINWYFCFPKHLDETISKEILFCKIFHCIFVSFK